MTHDSLTEPLGSFVASRSFDAGPQRLRKAIALMQSRPAEMHSVLRLAQLVGMSRSSFAEAFRLCFGRSPMEFLRSTRLNHAAELLRTSPLPIKLVGVTCGYNSRTSFANAFRRAYDASPADYRASYTKEHSSTDIHAVSDRLRSHRGTSQDLSWEVNLLTGAVWWSEGTFAALGYKTRKRLVSDVARFYERVHPDDRARIVESVSAACRGEQLTWNGEFQFKKADGTYTGIANGGVILRDVKGAALRLIGVMRVLDKDDFAYLLAGPARG